MLKSKGLLLPGSQEKSYLYRELTYPPGEKENHLQQCLGGGYVSSLEGIYKQFDAW